MSGLRPKKLLLELPLWQLTLPEFGWVYPDALAAEHYRAVKEALAAGEPVEDRILDTYPSLTRRKARGKANV